VRRHGNFSLPLPSARQKTLGKEIFVDEIFVMYSLPSATLSKAFAESKMAFVEHAVPVVMSISLKTELANLRD
jgi:hypothetical protein